MTLWLISLGVAASGWIAAYLLGRSDGKHVVRTEIVNKEIAAAERVRDAQAKAPTSSDAVLDSLSNGTRKL